MGAFVVPGHGTPGPMRPLTLIVNPPPGVGVPWRSSRRWWPPCRLRGSWWRPTGPRPLNTCAASWCRCRVGGATTCVVRWASGGTAAQVAGQLGGMQEHRIDRGHVAGRPFAGVLSIGLDAVASEAANRTRVPGTLAYVWGAGAAGAVHRRPRADAGESPSAGGGRCSSSRWAPPSSRPSAPMGRSSPTCPCAPPSGAVWRGCWCRVTETGVATAEVRWRGGFPVPRQETEDPRRD